MSETNRKTDINPTVLTREAFVAKIASDERVHMDAAIGRKAAAEMKKLSKKAAEASKMEHFNKMGCRQLEIQTRNAQVYASTLTTPPAKSTSAHHYHTELNVGDYVDVAPDLSPGHKSYCGKGWIVNVHHQQRE